MAYILNLTLALATISSKAARIGLVVYPGNEIVELRKNLWGVPDWYLLGAL